MAVKSVFQAQKYMKDKDKQYSLECHVITLVVKWTTNVYMW